MATSPDPLGIRIMSLLLPLWRPFGDSLESSSRRETNTHACGLYVSPFWENYAPSWENGFGVSLGGSPHKELTLGWAWRKHKESWRKSLCTPWDKSLK
jgi:hypothetical protein